MSGEPIALTRRTLLRFLCGGTALALGVDTRAIASAGTGEPGSAAAASDAAAAFARVGLRYLAVAPDERDRAVLAERLGTAGITGDVLAHVAALEQAVRRDFERGDILALDAWILSRTELRAAALLALTSPEGR